MGNSQGNEYVFATSAYNSVTRNLVITTSNGDIPEGTNVKITACHVKSPPKVTASDNTMTIKSSDNTAVVADAITAGALYHNIEHAHGAYRLGPASVALFTPG